ncbi:MAG TPA: hypothetical protein VLY23_12245 [Candidatus Acidoferrum sp.]|nr:hypothetical protein [Candidatus Acidoferrum sp.]
MAFGVFLLFGTAMASLAGVTLVWPRTALDHVWRLNPRAHQDLAPLGKLVGIPFLLLAVTLAIASAGWFRRRRWGWWLAVAVIATQLLGDLVNTLSGHFLEGGIGLAIAGALLFWLLRPTVESAFPN